MPSFRKGFTLIELLIVVALIGLLASISILILNGARQKQRDAKRVSDIQVVRTALESYWLRNAAYPSVGVFTDIGAGVYTVITSNGFEEFPPTGEVFLQRVPVGPGAGERYAYRGDAGGYSIRFYPEGDTIFGPGDGSTAYYAHSEVVDTDQALK